MQKLHPLVQLGILLGTACVLAALIGAFTIFRLRAQSDLVSVTGSAKVEVVSDQVKWSSQITRTVRISALKSGYEQIAKDLELVKKFLSDQGITETEYSIGTVSMMEVYQQDSYAERQYTLTQTIEVQSSDVAKLKAAADKSVVLISQGAIYSTVSLEYYYSKLPEARIELLSQAIADAKARAGELAKNSGKKVGSLKSATSGVVQVQSRNSTDVSDYGYYDTSKIEKQITVTVKATFTLR